MLGIYIYIARFCRGGGKGLTLGQQGGKTFQQRAEFRRRLIGDREPSLLRLSMATVQGVMRGKQELRLAGDIPQLVECLLSVHKALGSIPSAV